MASWFCTAARTGLLPALLLTSVASAPADDYFLTIGGGYAPSGNQVSLERNVLLQQWMIVDKYPTPPWHKIFFADGNEPERELQFHDEQKASDCPPAHRLMSEVFDSSESIGMCYRNHQIPCVEGPTERSAIRRAFSELGRELKPGDRLLVYVTGHGGPSSDEYDDDYDYEYDEEQERWVAKSIDDDDSSSEEFNTTFCLWGDEVSAREFSRWLDKISPEVPVVLVMVQCYAGGFANTIFHRNDPVLGISPAQRCGFFAQVHDRGSAGCSPDTCKADFQEYSTFFWAALRGKSITGEPIESADYDGDGHVSFAEAHAYTVIESNTLDIPVRTSDAFLRRYSRFRRSSEEEDEEESTVGRLFGNLLSGEAGGPPKLPEVLDAAGPLSKLMPLARPDQEAILAHLCEKLELAETATVEVVRHKLKRIETELATQRARYNGARSAQRAALSDLKEDVLGLWPELEGQYSPTTAELTSTRAEEFVNAVEKLPSYKSWTRTKDRVEEASDGYKAAVHTEAKAQRLLRTIENVVLAANLPHVAPPEIVDRYRQLLALEEGTLQTPEAAEPQEE